MRSSSIVATLVLASASLAAHAGTFLVTFGNASTSLDGSGTLTTGSLLAPGEYTIASFNGTTATSVGGPITTFSLLASGVFPTISNGGTFPANDNTLFVTNNVGSLDGDGLSFVTATGVQVNLYANTTGPDGALVEFANGTDVFSTVPVTISATPEPSSFALLGTGVVSIAGVLRRRLR